MSDARVWGFVLRRKKREKEGRSLWEGMRASGQNAQLMGGEWRAGAGMWTLAASEEDVGSVVAAV